MNKESFFKEHYLNIDVTLGCCHHTLKEIQTLREGSIIELDKLAGEPLDVIVDGENFAIGEAVVIDENYGIRVTELVEDKVIETIPYVTEPQKEIDEELPSQNESETTMSEDELDQFLSGKTLPYEIKDKNDSFDVVKKLSEENSLFEEDEAITYSKSFQNKKTPLSEEEINNLLATISASHNNDEFIPINSRRKIKLYDFKNPDPFSQFQIEALGDFFQRFCSIIPTIFNQQLSYKLESISQQPEYQCYEKNKFSFIDQWKLYSPNNYLELGFDDFAISQLSEIKKQGDFFSKEELDTLSSKLATPFLSLLSEAIEKCTEDSDTPKMIHVYSAPRPDFLQTAAFDQKEFSSFRIKEYTNKNSSMYVAIKIKVLSLTSNDSSGYITINIPAEDLKKFIEVNYYHYSPSDKKPCLDNVVLKVDARLGKTQKSISDIMDMGEGTIIELDRLSGQPVDLRVNGITIAYGDVTIIDENFGIEITKIL